jgi:hypothetical protein
MRILSGFAYLYMSTKVPSTGGLAVLGAGKPVGRKRGGGGYVFEICSSAVQNSNTRLRGSHITCFGGSGGRGVRDNHGYTPPHPVFSLYNSGLR